MHYLIYNSKLQTFSEFQRFRKSFELQLGGVGMKDLNKHHLQELVQFLTPVDLDNFIKVSTATKNVTIETIKKRYIKKYQPDVFCWVFQKHQDDANLRRFPEFYIKEVNKLLFIHNHFENQDVFKLKESLIIYELVNIRNEEEYEYSMHLIPKLIQAGANINIQDYMNDTPLHNTLCISHYKYNVILKMIKLLVKNKADIFAKNDDNETPLDVIFEITKSKDHQNDFLKAIFTIKLTEHKCTKEDLITKCKDLEDDNNKSKIIEIIKNI